MNNPFTLESASLLAIDGSKLPDSKPSEEGGQA